MNDEAIKHLFDGFSVAGTIGAVMGYLPDATAVLTFIWVVIRLYETKTVQRWLGNKEKERLGKDE